MKKLIYIFIAASMAFAYVSCDKEKETHNEDGGEEENEVSVAITGFPEMTTTSVTIEAVANVENIPSNVAIGVLMSKDPEVTVESDNLFLLKWNRNTERFDVTIHSLEFAQTYYVASLVRAGGRDRIGEVHSFTLGVMDMGTGVKWAIMNVGASAPDEVGDYFAWGEVEPYYSSQNPLVWKSGKEEGYQWSSYSYANGEKQLTKYCPQYQQSEYWNLSAKPQGADGLTTLLPEDDAAHKALGGNWRMPTKEDWEKLLENCDIDHRYYKDALGVMIWKRNEESFKWIFLPGNGFFKGTRMGTREQPGFWSISLDTEIPSNAWGLGFFGGRDLVSVATGPRNVGFPVRPVYEE